TLQPTAEAATSTPIPDFTPANPLEIAVTAAENFKRITPSPVPTLQPIELKEYPFPLMPGGANYKEIPGGIWYTVEATAEEVEEFYLDDRIYYRWNYKYGDNTVQYFDVQFTKYEDRQQLMVWENPAREVTVITMADLESLSNAIDELSPSVYQDDWLVLTESLNLNQDGSWNYEIDLPLPMLRAFYLSRMIDIGWQPFPIERPAPSILILQFERENERVSIQLEDSEAGTIVRGRRG
ncbi:MAG: hypothetical protein AAGD96_05150, partial [Chloroflexota bacterium]